MNAQKLFKISEPADKLASPSLEWNNSLISRKPVRIEYVPYPAESQTHCQKRAMIALCIFLALLVALVGMAMWLLWGKIS